MVMTSKECRQHSVLCYLIVTIVLCASPSERQAKLNHRFFLETVKTPGHVLWVSSVTGWDDENTDCY